MWTSLPMHTGLGLSSLVAHVLHYPPPPREQLCNRYCSNKYIHTLECIPLITCAGAQRVKQTERHRLLSNKRHHHHAHQMGSVWVDSDFASDIDTRKSVTGYLMVLNGGPVSWKASRQGGVTLSSSEAEFVAPRAGS